MNERRYEFGDEGGAGQGWVCAKIPKDGRMYKDCVPKVGVMVSQYADEDCAGQG